MTPQERQRAEKAIRLVRERGGGRPIGGPGPETGILLPDGTPARPAFSSEQTRPNAFKHTLPPPGAILNHVQQLAKDLMMAIEIPWKHPTGDPAIDRSTWRWPLRPEMNPAWNAAPKPIRIEKTEGRIAL